MRDTSRPPHARAAMTEAHPDARAPAFTAREFRAALGMFATGVTIVTARRADGTPVGLTANSFNSVSLQPPLVLWSLSRAAASLPVFRATFVAIGAMTAASAAIFWQLAPHAPVVDDG